MRLPLNCIVEYHEHFLSPEEAAHLFTELKKIVDLATSKSTTVDGHWHDTGTGKIMLIDAVLKEADAFPEEIWGPSITWPAAVEAVKRQVEGRAGTRFQVGVLLFYPDGRAGVDYHSDMVAYGDTTIIPSLSLGAERKFKLREKENGKEYALELANGSLVIMGEFCQARYEHTLPVNPACQNPRINLTFRKFGYAT